MKKLVLALVITAVLAIVVADRFIEVQPVTTPPDTPETPGATAVVSSCISCHSNKDILQAMASTEPTEEVSEATSGEG
jgi:hypothetical protein